jgi:hypothetical protein
MDSAWGIKPGSWAEDVEQEEAKNGPLRDEAFPTLGEAVKQDPKAVKTGGKKKPVKMGLTDFLGAQTARRSAPSDKELLMALPKGSSGLPREDRESKGLGGGFKDYGGNRDGASRLCHTSCAHALLQRLADSVSTSETLLKELIEDMVSTCAAATAS